METPRTRTSRATGRRARTAAVGLLLAVATAAAQVSDIGALEALKAVEQRRFEALAARGGLATASGEGLDALHYRLDLQIRVNPSNLIGAVTMTARVTAETVASAVLDFTNSLTVDSVTVAATRTSFARSAGLLVVTLDRTYTRDELLVLTVFYRGVPTGSGFGSFIFSSQLNGTPWIWSLSEPYGARDWWPCIDHPTDKADSVDLRITVPGTFKAGSQGILAEIVQNGDGTRTFVWKHRYPIATYLVSVAVTNYAEFSDWYRPSAADSMEVLNYVLPEALQTARAQLPRTVRMLEVFSDLYGEYPFVKEKYGHAQFGWGGGMEHQTMTSLGAFSEGLVAHELAHQWFGDMITMRTWPDIWLNEGFATYSVALYYEKVYGREAYQSYMRSNLQSAMNAVVSLRVRDTLSIATLFSSSLVYSKGAAVLHMLRRVVGDSLFFAGLKAYASDPRLRFNTASTEDLRGVFEAITGQLLRYFFDQWVDGTGYPIYSFLWGSEAEAGGYRVRVALSQTNAVGSATVFRMPIDVTFYGGGTSTIGNVFNDSLTQVFDFHLPFKPDSVRLDADGWLLATSTGIQVGLRDGEFVPFQFVLGQNYPNPFNPSTTIPWGISESSRVRISVYDFMGRMLAALVDERRGPGYYTTFWKADLPTGVYLCRLEAEPVSAPGRVFSETRKMLLVR